MQGLGKAILRRVGAMAAAVAIVTSSAIAAGDANSTQPQTQKIEQSTNTIAIATLGLAPVGPIDAEPDLLINRFAPMPSSPMPDTTIVGIASFYDIPGETASGEQYDPKAFTAAAQLEIRDKFGGIKFGRLYQESYAVAEYAGKKLILKFNDVGPLRPGRKFDLSRAAMEYFDGIEKGLLPDFKVTVLPFGRAYTPGPVTDEQLVAMGFGKLDFKLASAGPVDARASSSDQSDVEPPIAPVDTAPTQVASIDPGIDAARECKDTGTAVAQDGPPVTPWQHLVRVSAWVDETAQPMIELDRWEAIENWSLADGPGADVEPLQP
jgi:peptidoglycan lytic transglycosylase